MSIRTYVSVPKPKAGAGYANEAIHAMRQGHVVEFIYDGKLRLVEVHAVGQSNTGKLVMRGYQIGGQASRPLPQWTLFDLAKVEALEAKPIASDAPREGYAMADKQMALIFAELVL